MALVLSRQADSARICRTAPCFVPTRIGFPLDQAQVDLLLAAQACIQSRFGGACRLGDLRDMT
jgi:hypothetical protein